MIDSNFLKIDKIISPNVSRETLEDLKAYTNSIIEKNRTINLISKSTENAIKQIDLIVKKQVDLVIN